MSDTDIELPTGGGDEREMYLGWLAYLRGAVLRNVEGLSDTQSRWQPGEALIPLLGIVNHLTRVEWRWIDGEMRGAVVDRSESEFSPGPELTLARAVAGYHERAAATAAVVRSLPLDAPCQREPNTDLRWVMVHLINETARHAGHADAVRELLDGKTGE